MNRTARQLVGVGIDVESRDALARYSDEAVRRFAERWLTPAERTWCAGQSDVRAAVVACLCGKEAVWKASRGVEGIERIGVASARGLRRRVRIGDITVVLRWRLGRRDVLTTAVALQTAHPPARQPAR